MLRLLLVLLLGGSAGGWRLEVQEGASGTSCHARHMEVLLLLLLLQLWLLRLLLVFESELEARGHVEHW